MAERFGWIGISRRKIVDAAILSILCDWSAAWAIGPRSWEIVPAEDASVAVAAVDDTSTLALATSGGLAGFLAGIDASEPSNGLAVHVADEAFDALFRGLAGPHAGLRRPLTMGQFPGALYRADRGAVRVCVASPGMRIDAWLSRQVVDRLAPPGATRVERLTSRRAALDTTRVGLRTELDLGTIALADIRHLRRGDVIATSTPLDATFDVVEKEKGRTLFTASLGARGHRRAIRILEPRNG